MSVDPKQIPAAFGDNREAEVWSKEPLERARPFWEALEWLDAGHWKNFIDADRAAFLRKGILEGIAATCADFARKWEADGTWRNPKWPLWAMNQTNADDPDCLYRTGIIPPRLACWPQGQPYPTDLVELAAMMDEFKNWMTTPAGRAKFSEAEAQQTAQGAEIVGEIAWQQLSGEHRG